MFKRTTFFWECVRKAFHLSSLLIVVGYTLLLNYFSDKVVIMIMTAVLLLLLEVERIRLDHHKSAFVALLNNMLRRKEKDNISGVVFMVASSIIAFSAFDYWVALTAMLMTVFGDMSAALFGRAFGKKRIYRHKTWVGTLAAFIANFLVGLLVIPQFAMVYLPMAVVATAVELFTHKLDDNLTVPLFAGFVGQMIVYYTDISLPPIDFTFLGLF